MSVYLDHAATTPMRPEVLEAMGPYLTEHFGNPSSIHGAGRRARLGLDEAREVVTTSVEHKAVIHSCAVLERFGFRVTYLPVDRYGRVDPADVESAIGEHTTVVSVMYANNEGGTVQRIREIGEICRSRKALFHVDAIQAAPFLPLDV